VTAASQVRSRSRSPIHTYTHTHTTQTCPFLLRVFTKVGSRRGVYDYARGRELPSEEVQIYTWRDATLRELADLVRQVRPEARRRGARLQFALVYPDRRGVCVMRHIGECPGPNDGLTLDAFHFEIGDYLDVAISTKDDEQPQRFHRRR